MQVDAYSEAPIDILDLSITEIQEYIDDGIITYELLTRLYLDRIEAYDSNYNSIISVNEEAINQAKLLDLEYKETGRRSELHGIPVILKDNIDYVLMPTTGGTKALSDSYPNKNASVVDKIINAGGIIIAKANMDQFAFTSYQTLSSFGTTKNAYNNSYTPYGSSGGTAVSVALQFATVGIGTDTNASIRVPSSAASLIGLRPSFNLISTEGILPYDKTRDTVGPMTKYVSDNAILLSIMSDNDYKITTSETIKIGVLTEGIDKAYSEIKNIFESKMNELKNKNITLVQINDFYNSDTDFYYSSTLGGSSWCTEFNKYIQNTSSKIKSLNDLYKSNYNLYNVGEYIPDCGVSAEDINNKSKSTKDEYRNYIDKIMNKYDVNILVYPTTTNKITLVNNPSVSNLSYAIASTVGYPAINVPAGYDSTGLPYGIEFLAKDETILYKVANTLENVYKLPSGVPSLYNSPINIDVLIEYKLEDITKGSVAYTDSSIEKYNDIKNKIDLFFLNYNDYENKSETVNNLINEYTETVDNMEELVFDTFIKNTGILCLIFLIVIIILIIVIMIIKNRLKRLHKKRH